MHAWYFAYGSNLLAKQMIARTGSIGHPDHAPRSARLANFRLAFEWWGNQQQAFANIATPGPGVMGVVYRCSQADLESLDRFEVGYRRQEVTVTDEQGNELAAVAYVIRPALRAMAGPPSAEYLERIVTGAREHGLPERYISEIIALAGEPSR